MTAMAPDDEFVCFGDRHVFETWSHSAPNVTRVVIPQRISPALAASADGNRSLGDMWRLTRAVWRHRPRVFFSPSVYTYFPLPPGQRAVVTVHDTIAERFPHLTLPTQRARLFWRLKVGLALRQANLVLTVSEYSAASIVSALGVPRSQIRIAVEAPAVAYMPSDPSDVTAAARRAGLPPGARWFVYVGGFAPHKRVDAIIEAHAAIAAGNGTPPRLLLVGSLDADVFLAEVGRLRAMIARAGTASLVHWLGFVADEELRHFVSGAVASILPSECEGFGLPAVEAAACGTPVIATRESPLPALLEGGGIFVRPGDAAGITDAMRVLLTDGERRGRLGARARERASALTWSSSARSALDAIYEAAA
jgi:glycosyltransferase involved in cell wall biosynthesis